MISYEWGEDKNKKLIRERGIGFEIIVQNIYLQKPLAIIDHPNQKRYPNQKIIVVKINNYVWLVPFLKKGSIRFLKTAYPSRQATNKYLKRKK